MFIFSVSLRTALPLLRHDTISMPYTPYQCDGLALGAMLACQWFAPEQLSDVSRKILRMLNENAAILVWTLLFILEIWLYPIQGRRNLNTSFQMTLVTFASYRLLGMIVLKRDGRLVWLASKPLVFFGSISYGFYLYHGFILGAISRKIGPVDMTHPLVVFARLILGLGMSIAFSYASLRWVELPIRRLRRYLVSDVVPNRQPQST